MVSKNILKYLPLAILPIISATMWLAMLLAFIIYWEAHGHSHLPSMETAQRIAHEEGRQEPPPGEHEQHIPYISDLGAVPRLKPLLIIGAVITSVFLDLALLSERWLRHRGRLASNRNLMEKVLVGLAILFAIAGTHGLILLSCYDTLGYRIRHDGFLALFMASYILCAICICAEYYLLARHFRRQRILTISFVLKLWFILVEVSLAIAFGVISSSGYDDVAAVFEWIMGFLFTFWVLSFVLDLLPAAGGEQVKGNEMAVKEPMHGSEYMGDGSVANVGDPMVNEIQADGAVNGSLHAHSVV